jgi:steroid 5-alpha reductase family enzyme
MMHSIKLFLGGLAGMSVMQGGLWVYQQHTRNANVVDVGWTAGLGALSLLYAARGRGLAFNRAVQAVMAGVWSARLGAHLTARIGADVPEDKRYQQLRAQWGPECDKNMFLFFQAQALLSSILSLPLLAISARRSMPAPRSVALATSVWAVAVVGESTADRQLHEFRSRAENKERTCREGLWHYSRHPNYFFEWLYWLAYIPLTAHTPWTLLAGVTSPALMYLAVTRVTGIPPTEAQALKSRKDYKEYQHTTNAFFPWFPKRPSEDGR